MSTEWYVQGHRDGDADGIRLPEVLRIFGLAEDDAINGVYLLSYEDGNSCDLTISVEDGLVTSLCIVRPCVHIRLSDSLHALLRAGPYVLYAPDGNAPVVARSDMEAHLPEGMVASLGKPVVVDHAVPIGKALYG